MFEIGWFSSGRDEAAGDLLRVVYDEIQNGYYFYVGDVPDSIIAGTQSGKLRNIVIDGGSSSSHGLCGRGRASQLGVALLLDLERQFPPTGFDDAAVAQDVHEIRQYVVEQALIVGDEKNRHLGVLLGEGVYAPGNDLQSVDVQPRVRFVHDGQ